MTDDEYRALVQRMVRAQEQMLRKLMTVDDNIDADLELLPAHVTAHAAASALMVIALVGTLSAGDKEIFAEGLNAAMASFAKALESAPRVWETSEARMAGLH